MSKKMLYVRSKDYWGYDASDFDATMNFYTYTWVVPEAMYNGMDDSNKSRLYPCALFYVQGVTDNHNFLTISVNVDGSNATVKGMQGTKRRTRKFEVGVPFAYTVGSLTMKEAPAGSTTVDAIQEDVKEGRATTEGSFIIDGFLTDASDIAEVVGLSTVAEAETITEPADMVSPMEDEPTPSGYEPESYEAEIDDSVTVSDFYPQESAQTHDVASGHGVPVAYGSGSSQNLEPPVVVDEEMAAEYQKGRRGAGGRFRSKRAIRNEVFGETVANQMAGYWRTGVVGTNPVVGSDVARSNQDKRYKYFTEPAVRNENTGMFNKGPNFRQAHKIAKGVAWDRVERLGLAAEAEVLMAESKFETLASKIAKQYEKKGMEPGKAMDIGRRTAYKVGVSKYGKSGMTRKSIAGRKAAESYSADRFVDSLNEAAPARLPIKGMAAAIVGTLLGVGYAMKK